MKFTLIMPAIFERQKIWVSASYPFTFVITEDSAGFSASARNAEDLLNRRYEFGGYGSHKTFESAKAACEEFLKKLRH